MLFVILILMILVAAWSIWRGHGMSVPLFILAAISIAIVFALDIDTPLPLTF